jgi:hypothetical protein
MSCEFTTNFYLIVTNLKTTLHISLKKATLQFWAEKTRPIWAARERATTTDRWPAIGLRIGSVFLQIMGEVRSLPRFPNVAPKQLNSMKIKVLFKFD